jgi:hypothetical protein
MKKEKNKVKKTDGLGGWKISWVSFGGEDEKKQ